MEFSFETLAVYQKAIGLYELISGKEEEGSPGNGQSYVDLKRRIIEVCQRIVTGTSRWEKEKRAEQFLRALDLNRSLAPLVEGARIDGHLAETTRDLLREEIDGLSRMLSSLARKTREWNGEDKGRQEKKAPSGKPSTLSSKDKEKPG